MFEVNLLSSDDVVPPIRSPERSKEPEIIDLLSSSPVAAPPAAPLRASLLPSHSLPEPKTPPRSPCSGFYLSSSPILVSEVSEEPPNPPAVPPGPTELLRPAVLPETAEPPRKVPTSGSPEPEKPAKCAIFHDTVSLESSPHKQVHSTSAAAPALAEVSTNIMRGPAKRSLSTGVAPSQSGARSKRFKATKSNSAPAAVKLVTDRKKACAGIKCTVWESSNQWTTLMDDTFSAVEVDARCIAASTPLDQEGVAAIVSVHGEFSDEWLEEQNVFVRAEPHTEYMDTHIVVLQASYLDTLGKQDRGNREDFFTRIRRFITESEQCQAEFNILYVVPEVHAEFRKIMAAYDRRLRQRVMDHSKGREVIAEAPPQQHYFNEVQVRLQVENGIHAVYPRSKGEAAEMMANWIIDMCFSRYRMKTDATLEGVGGTVKSKSAIPEIAAEALAVVHGLPPRIASSIAGDMKSMGNIYTSMGPEKRHQLSRLRYYGKGDWNESLIALLTCDDPDQPIGQA